MQTTFSLAALTAVAAFVAPVATVSTASAEPVLPTQWTPGDAGSTAQAWDLFTSQTANTPDVLDLNTNGSASAYDANFPASGSFITGGGVGNIYSFSGAIYPAADVPHFGATGGAFTTVLVNLATAGTSIDPDTATLSDGTSTFAPDDAVLVSLGDSGNPNGGTSEEWFFQFNLAGSADRYGFVVEAIETSLSYDKLRVDTFTSAAPVIEPTPDAVPEPASMFGMVAAGVLLLRRRR